MRIKNVKNTKINQNIKLRIINQYINNRKALKNKMSFGPTTADDYNTDIKLDPSINLQ